MTRVFGRLLAVVRAVAAFWVIACFSVMTLAVWAQVGGRYVFNYSIAGATEVATVAQIWMVLVGAGVAARYDLHARIDILINMFPERIRRVLMVAAALLGLWFLLSIVRGSLPMLQLGQFQTTPALQIPMWIPYLGLLVGPLYFAVEVIAATARNWRSTDAPAGSSDIL